MSRNFHVISVIENINIKAHCQGILNMSVVQHLNSLVQFVQNNVDAEMY